MDVCINLNEDCHRFFVGQMVRGDVDVTVPEDVPISNVIISFHCLGEVKWIEYPGTPYYLNGFIYYDKYSYLEEELPIDQTDITVIKKNVSTKIPFEFSIPDDQNLPSTMISSHGFIQYFVKVTIRLNDEIKKFIKELIVEAPIEENLMITVGGSAEKSVLLHSGRVSMHASIGRKGFAPGETIPVHVSVDNRTTTRVTPRISLHQTQIYMCGARHKTIETTLSNDPVTAAEPIEPHTEAVDVLHVTVPLDESLSIKSPVITVKYFLHVTLDIPHSFDLHINLPIVLTSGRVIESFRDRGNSITTFHELSRIKSTAAKNAPSDNSENIKIDNENSTTSVSEKTFSSIPVITPNSTPINSTS